MRLKHSFWLVSVVVIAVGVVLAVLVNSGMILPRTVPPEGVGPTSLVTPVWSVGDRWTYNVTVSADPKGDDSGSDRHLFVGSVTKEVVGIVGEAEENRAYNVTTQANIGGIWTTPMENLPPVQVSSAQIEHYAWYRVEDLAKVREVLSAHFSGLVPFGPNTVLVSFTAQMEAVYEPVWDSWSFPIDENETWNVTSDAHIRITSELLIEGGDARFAAEHDLSFSEALNYSMMSDGFEDVVTPAGTFSALQMSAFLKPPEDGQLDGILQMALLLGGDANSMRHASLEMWFSEEVGNVVRIVAQAAGDHAVRVQVILESFHRA